MTSPADRGLAGEPPTTEDRGSFCHGVCRVCGWRGPGRRARRVARADAEAHGTECPGIAGRTVSDG